MAHFILEVKTCHLSCALISPKPYHSLFVLQCCGRNAYHKLVDNLNLFDGMKCYINSSFKYGGSSGDVNFEYRDIDNGDDGFFGI